MIPAAMAKTTIASMDMTPVTMSETTTPGVPVLAGQDWWHLLLGAGSIPGRHNGVKASGLLRSV